jgi:hypothetical protein
VNLGKPLSSELKALGANIVEPLEKKPWGLGQSLGPPQSRGVGPRALPCLRRVGTA